MSDEEIGQMFTAMGTALQDNTAMLSALVGLLIEKKVFTIEEYKKAKHNEDSEIERLVVEALNNMTKESDDSKTDFGFMGKGGDA